MGQRRDLVMSWPSQPGVMAMDTHMDVMCGVPGAFWWAATTLRYDIYIVILCDQHNDIMIT